MPPAVAGPGVRRLVGALIGLLLTPAAVLALGHSQVVHAGSGDVDWGAGAVVWLLLGLVLLAVVALSGRLSSLGPVLGGLLGGVIPGALVLQDPRRGVDALGLRQGRWEDIGWAAQFYLLGPLPLLVGVLLCAVGAAASTSRIPPLPRRGGAGAALQVLWTALSVVTVAGGLLAYGWGFNRLEQMWLQELLGQELDRAYPPGAALGLPLFWLILGLGLVTVVVGMGGRWWVAPLLPGGLLLGLGVLRVIDREAFGSIRDRIPSAVHDSGASALLGDPVPLSAAGVVIIGAGVVGLLWGRALRGAGPGASSGLPRGLR